MWNIVLAVVLAVHSLIHLFGFVVAWKLVELKDMPYKTTILAGRWDVGDAGVRLFGVLWVAVAIAFIVVVIGLVMNQSWWHTLAIGVALASLIICALHWPEAQFGAYVNVVILAFILVGPQVGWLSSRFRL